MTKLTPAEIHRRKMQFKKDRRAQEPRIVPRHYRVRANISRKHPDSKSDITVHIARKANLGRGVY